MLQWDPIYGDIISNLPCSEEIDSCWLGQVEPRPLSQFTFMAGSQLLMSESMYKSE